MAPSRSAFRTRFRGLSPTAATEYLADLYTAQGWSVEHEDGRLAVTRGDQTETVVLADAVTDIEQADVVITRRGESGGIVPAGAAHLDADDIYERTRYAVDEGASHRLLSTHFGDQLEASEPAPVPTGHDEIANTADETKAVGQVNQSGALNRWSRRALLVAGGAAIGGAAVAATDLTGSQSVAAPGVTAAGVSDPDALAEAHAAANEGRSYTLELEEFRRNDALELQSAIALDISLAADRSYLAIVSTAGSEAPLVLGRPPATAVYWSDGEQYFVDHRPDAWAGVSSFRPHRGWVGTWRYWSHSFAFGGQINSSPADYFRALFDAVPLRLVERREVGDGRRYRLVGRAAAPETPLEPLAGSDHREMELTAVVDGDGLVRSHEVSYHARFNGDTGRVRRALAYTRVGETTVDRPIWTGPLSPALSTGGPMTDE